MNFVYKRPVARAENYVFSLPPQIRVVRMYVLAFAGLALGSGILHGHLTTYLLYVDT